MLEAVLLLFALFHDFKINVKRSIKLVSVICCYGPDDNGFVHYYIRESNYYRPDCCGRIFVSAQKSNKSKK